MNRKGNGRSVCDHVAAMIGNLLDLTIGAALRAVKSWRERPVLPLIDVELLDTCPRCKRAVDVAMGQYLIYREHIWHVGCWSQSRGGLVVPADPLSSARAGELGLLN